MIHVNNQTMRLFIMVRSLELLCVFLPMNESLFDGLNVYFTNTYEKIESKKRLSSLKGASYALILINLQRENDEYFTEKLGIPIEY